MWLFCPQLLLCVGIELTGAAKNACLAQSSSTHPQFPGTLYTATQGGKRQGRSRSCLTKGSLPVLETGAFLLLGGFRLP